MSNRSVPCAAKRIKSAAATVVPTVNIQSYVLGKIINITLSYT